MMARLELAVRAREAPQATEGSAEKESHRGFLEGTRDVSKAASQTSQRCAWTRGGEPNPASDIEKRERRAPPPPCPSHGNISIFHKCAADPGGNGGPTRCQRHSTSIKKYDKWCPRNESLTHLSWTRWGGGSENSQTSDLVPQGVRRTLFFEIIHGRQKEFHQKRWK